MSYFSGNAVEEVFEGKYMYIHFWPDFELLSPTVAMALYWCSVLKTFRFIFDHIVPQQLHKHAF